MSSPNLERLAQTGSLKREPGDQQEFALAALRWHGYRSENRYLVFQCLPHTLGVGAEVWRVLALCHDRRNRAEYEGAIDIDEQLVADLLLAAEDVQGKVIHLGPLPRSGE